MCKKLICMVSMVLVLALAAASPAGLDDDPNLVAWWRFDGDATDSSGNGHDGTLMGNPAPVFADGMIDQALDTTESGGPGYVEITGYKGILGGNPFSITAWIYTSDSSGTFMGWGSTAAGTTRFEFRPNADELRAESSGNVQGLTKLPNNEWIHIAVTVKADAVISEPEVTLYLNGQVDNDPSTGGTAALAMAAGNDVTIARRHTSGRWFDALIDDVRLYSRELTAEEVKELATPPRAHEPIPADGEVLTATWITLQWSASYGAVSHDVYIGTNPDDVAARTADTYQGNQTSNSLIAGIQGFLYPEGLPLRTTYYWLVDEVKVDGTIQAGNVWSFFVPPTSAYNPDPTDGIEFIASDVTLTWESGMNAIYHNVYLGDNFDDVNNAVGGPPVMDTTYTPPTLERGKTYYWRVDEFNPPTTVKGDVWSFTTIPPIAVGDPNLVGWWKLDEGLGGTVVDYSGYDHHGTIGGSTFWADGYDLGAMEFTGAGSYVEMTGYEGVTGTNPRTTTAWIRTTTSNGTILAWGVNSAGQKWRVRVDGTGGLRAEVNGGYHYGVTNIADGRWHHMAVTWEDDGTPDALDLVLYVDSRMDATSDMLDEPMDTSAAGVVRIGESAWVDTAFIGLIDEVRIYDKVLTLEEIQLAMRIDPLLAWAPSPADGSLVPMNVAGTPSWSAGDGASLHDVYFDPNQAAVAAADASDTTGVYRGRQSTTSYALPEGVDPNSGPLYWRVDEVANDGTIVEGRLWSFSVLDYALVEDFESYNDIESGQPGSNLVHETWLDGYGTTTNGSTMGYTVAFQPTMEPNNVHGGLLSAPMAYNNITTAFSEVTRTFTAQNWAANGIQTLSLWFAGAGTNVPGQLYVKVNGVQANYDGDVTNLRQSPWQVCNIDLASIGTDLSNVTSLAIGIQGPGATGTLLLDDIRLYPFPRELITPVQPDPAGLVAQYAFEGNANDSSGNGLHGTLMGGPTFAVGNSGQAINFDGVDDYVEIVGYKGILGPNAVTVTAWIKTISTGTADTGLDSTNAIVGWGPNTGGQRFGFRVDDGRLRTEHHGGNIQGNSQVADGEWHHAAVTVQANSTVSYPQVRLWLDGLDDTRPGTDPDAYDITADLDVSIGRRPASNDRFFTGQIDDVRIYDRALSAEEIAGMAGISQPYDKPF